MLPKDNAQGQRARLWAETVQVTGPTRGPSHDGQHCSDGDMEVGEERDLLEYGIAGI
jgi:hypothetical protein